MNTKKLVVFFLVYVPKSDYKYYYALHLGKLNFNQPQKLS